MKVQLKQRGLKERQLPLCVEPAAITGPVLQHLSDVASLRLADHQQRFRKDFKASRESVKFLSKVVEDDGTAPIDLEFGVSGKRPSAKMQVTQDLIRLRDENAELILALQQNSEKLTGVDGGASDRGGASAATSSSSSYSGVVSGLCNSSTAVVLPSSPESSCCTEWRRSVFHFSTLALLNAQQTAQLQRREQRMLSINDLATRIAHVLEENQRLTSECTLLEQELAGLERDGETLDLRAARWSAEQSFFDPLPERETVWKQLFTRMERLIKETMVPQREVDAAQDIVDAALGVTGAAVLAAHTPSRPGSDLQACQRQQN
jgi:hypothetical protein